MNPNNQYFDDTSDHSIGMTRSNCVKEDQIWGKHWPKLLRGAQGSAMSFILADYLGRVCHAYLEGSISAVDHSLWQICGVQEKMVCPIRLDKQLAYLYWFPFDLHQLPLFNSADQDALFWVTWSLFDEIYQSMWAFHCGLAMYHSENKRLAHNQSSSMRPFLESMVQKAYQQKASDIHFSYGAGGGQIVFRVHGQLMPYQEISAIMSQHLSNCIKVSAGLDIASHSKPMESGFECCDILIRISIIPLFLGEKMAMRLPRQSVSMGWSRRQKEKVHRAVSSHAGLILVVGPTGVGKSTTLYTLLDYIDFSGKQVVMLEDPVEKKIPGVCQVQISPAQGLDFHQVLPQILRQDPDVIVVGEIRDSKTASLCAEAVMTGHLVLSSIHAETCFMALLRFKSLLHDHVNFCDDAIRLMINQRLVFARHQDKSSGDAGQDATLVRLPVYPLWAMQIPPLVQDYDYAVFWEQAKTMSKQKKIIYSDVVRALGGNLTSCAHTFSDSS